jgi:Uma2 family endonuclease
MESGFATGRVACLAVIGLSSQREPSMSTTTITRRRRQPAAAPLAAPEVYRLTVDEYERMAAAGALNDDQIELIGGLLVKKMTQNPPHPWVVEATHDQLGRLLPRGWFIREEKPVRISEFDEPEPDLAVIRGTRDDFRSRHPGPKDVALLVEIADRSLDRDRGEKRAAYARGRIPVYWIVNLVDRQVEVFSGPSARGYRSSRVYKPGQEIPVVIAGAEVGRIPVAAILP